MLNQNGRPLHVFAPITKDGKVLFLKSDRGYQLPHGENGNHGHDVFLRELLQRFFETMTIGKCELVMPPEKHCVGTDVFLCVFLVCEFAGVPYAHVEGHARFMPKDSFIPGLLDGDFCPFMQQPELLRRLP